MILLQVLTGRRASEIRTCEFDCLSRRRHPPSRQPPGRRWSDFGTPRARSTSRRTASSSTVKSPQSSRSSNNRSGRAYIGDNRGSFSCNATATGRRRALPARHLQLGPPRVQQRRPNHRQQGSATATEPHPPVPAHRTHPARRTRPAHPRSCSATPGTRPRRWRCTTSPNARNTPSRRSWPPPSRQGRRHPGRVRPAGPRQPAPVRPGRPPPAQRLVSPCPAADLRQGQRLPDLLGLRHRRPQPRRRPAAARNRGTDRPQHGRVPATTPPSDPRGRRVAGATTSRHAALTRLWPPCPTTRAERCKAAAAAQPLPQPRPEPSR